MSHVVETIRNRINSSCLSEEKMSKGKCEVDLDDAPSPSVIVDLDKPGAPLSASQVRCDYLFFGEASKTLAWVAPIEIKDGAFKVSGIVRQLQAGARASEKIIRRKNVGNFRPIAAVRGPVSRAQLFDLKRQSNQITLHRQQETVRVIGCGDALSSALEA